MASSSSSSHRYHVFLSFRGEDTRLNFTGHLCEALRASGINTFIDDDELRRGEVIRDELLREIQRSRVSIIIFSRRYGDSSWCLDELVEIMKCRRTARQIVIPIFYDVDPSDVRKQSGSFGEAFGKHEKRFASDLERVLRWREALAEAADLSGWDLKNTLNGHEAKFIKEIVKSISKELNCTDLFVALYPIGIESRVRAMNSMLDVEPNDKACVGIWGMGGVGKTTIAKAIYNQTYDGTFDGRSFLANVREKWSQPNGPVLLQEQLLSDILKSEVHVGSVDRGIKVIEERLSCLKVLILVDDVDHIKQLNALARHNVWFGPGSRIIVTTRNEHVLKQLGVDAIYKAEEMNGTESLGLLSWYAFRRSDPNEEYSELSRMVVDYCGGLPLALEVLGSFLYGRSTAEWQNTLEKLKTSPDKDIMKVLQISFDGLEDKVKHIFLDISCFFIGMNKDYVELILDGCEHYAKIGINVLLERSLLTIRGNDKLVMHDLLRDMGRDLVQEEFPKQPGKWSRLWSPKVVSDVLNKQTGTKYVEGLTLNVEDAKKVSFSTNAFKKMRRLRLLQLNHVQLNGSYVYLSEDLRWLCWLGFPLEFIPNNFYLGNLVALDLQYSNLAHVWEEPKLLEKLKILNLSHSRNLRQTPDFSYIPNLEQLIMIACESLEEVHDSIGLLEKLVLVNLKGCTSLKKPPKISGKLKSLISLFWSGCPPLENSGDSDFWPLRIITRFVPPWLKEFYLMQCNMTDDAIPKELGSLPSLEKLAINASNVRNLPNLDGLSCLKLFALYDCDRLQSIPDLPTKVENIGVFRCGQLKRFPDMSRMPDLSILALVDCFNLVGVPDLNKLLTKSLEKLIFANMPTLNEAIIWEIINKRCNNILNTHLLGDDIPRGFTFIDEGNSVWVEVPQRVNCKLDGFACCILYSFIDTSHLSSEHPHLLAFNSKKGYYVRAIYLMPHPDDQLWMRLVYFKFRCSFEVLHDFSLESGDKFWVGVSAVGVRVKKIGVFLLWENENTSVYDDFVGGKCNCKLDGFDGFTLRF